MSQQLARRTGTVGALALLVGVTSVAGVWPVLGTASAAELRPGRVHEAAETVGKDAAPGQVQKSGEVTTEQRGVEEPKAVQQEPAQQEPVTGPPTGLAAAPSPQAPGPKSAVAPAAAEASAATPSASEPKPTAAPAKQPDRKMRQKPASVPAAVAPDATSDRGVLAPRSARAPRRMPPAAQQPPTSAPAAGPVIGPVMPPQVLTPAQLPRSVPASIAPARSGAGSRPLPVAAADALPLRPAGAEPLTAPAARPVPGTDPLAFTLGALPGFAAGTAEAVARRPGLPIGLAAVVVVFLLLQNRIDRRDPKLALAPLEEDEGLEFGAGAPVRVRLAAV